MHEVFEKIIEKLEERTSFLSDCTKYGNKDAEQQNKSYSTMMMYEVSDLVDDLIEIVEQAAAEHQDDEIISMVKANAEHSKAVLEELKRIRNNSWIPVKDRLPETDDEVLVSVRMRDSGEEEECLLAISSYREETFGGKGLGYKDWKAAWEYWGYWEVVAWQPLPQPYQLKGEKCEQ